MSEKIPIISCFTGGGFLDMGFEMSNFNVVWTNEMDPSFIDMYEVGYSNWRKQYFKLKNQKSEITYKKSIESISPEDILSMAFPRVVPDIFGVIGGPPCQDFSGANSNVGFKGDRGRLTKVYLNYIKEMQPDFFILENVKNLARNKTHYSNLQRVLRTMIKDYYVDIIILNAIHYGVPQDRKRLFIVGIKKAESEQVSFLEKKFTFPEPPVDKKYSEALTKYSWPKTNIFQNGISRPTDIPPELMVDECLIKPGEDNEIPNAKEYYNPYSKKFTTTDEGDTKNRSFKRLHRFRYSPTVCYGNNEIHLHPYEARRLSVRESMRLQTIPDDYILPSEIGLSKKFKMIGNAVPVNLSRSVAETLYKLLVNIKSK